MKKVKFTNHDLQKIILNEGLSYSIMNYCSSKNIKDEKIGKLWDEAKRILIEIEEIVFTSEISKDDIL